MAGTSKKPSPKTPKRTRQSKAATSETKSASKSPKTTRQGKAAAPETRSASKSPKKTRQDKAAASGTESGPKSPKTTQQGKATVSETGSGDFNEDYNIRSPERTKLLTKIKGVIKNAPVSPAFWACCQLADMNRLQSVAKWEKEVIFSYQDSLAFIALQCEC